MLPEQLPLPLARLGSATGNPARVIGVHFFNPVPVTPLAEVISALRTSGDVVRRLPPSSPTGWASR